eukprot:2760053-Rhodomonas_salina.4
MCESQVTSATFLHARYAESAICLHPPNAESCTSACPTLRPARYPPMPYAKLGTDGARMVLPGPRDTGARLGRRLRILVFGLEYAYARRVLKYWRRGIRSTEVGYGATIGGTPLVRTLCATGPAPAAADSLRAGMRLRVSYMDLRVSCMDLRVA